MKQKLTFNGKTDNSKLTVGDFNTATLSNKEKKLDRKSARTYTINQPDLNQIYRTLQQQENIYFFPSAHGTLSRINHMRDHKCQ